MAYLQPSFPNGDPAADYSSDPFINGFALNIVSDTTFTLSAGTARAYASSEVIFFPANSANEPGLTTVNISTVGKLGCYPHSLASLGLTAETSFGIYILGDSSGKNSPTYVVATGDHFLVPGYNIWRRIGAVLIANSTLFLIPMSQTGLGNERTYVLRSPIAGAAYGPTNFFEAPLSIGSGFCNPFFNEEGLFIRELTSANLTDYGSISTFNSVTFGVKPPFSIVSPATGSPLRDEVWVQTGRIASGSVVYITVSGAGAIMAVGITGFKEYMGLQAI